MKVNGPNVLIYQCHIRITRHSKINPLHSVGGFLITSNMSQKTFTLDELKKFAFYAVQYASKLELNGVKVIKKVHIDNFIDLETDNINPSDFKPPIDNFQWFKTK